MHRKRKSRRLYDGGWTGHSGAVPLCIRIDLKQVEKPIIAVSELQLSAFSVRLAAYVLRYYMWLLERFT